MTTNDITTTLDQVEVGRYPAVPGTYRSRLTRTEKRNGGRVAAVAFGDRSAA